MPYRCVIADDHPAILDAVSRYLADVEDVEVVAQAQNGAEALRLIGEHAPDVAIVDVRMPNVDGIEIARRLSSEGSPTAVILYTGHSDRSLLLEALDAGARGFLVKEAPLDDLARAIRTICDGGTYVDPALAGLLAGPQAAERLPTVTKREREILRLLADGMRNEQVAQQLSISPLTVRTHEERDAQARGGHTDRGGRQGPARVADRVAPFSCKRRIPRPGKARYPRAATETMERAWPSLVSCQARGAPGFSGTAMP